MGGWTPDRREGSTARGHDEMTCRPRWTWSARRLLRRRRRREPLAQLPDLVAAAVGHPHRCGPALIVADPAIGPGGEQQARDVQVAIFRGEHQGRHTAI